MNNPTLPSDDEYAAQGEQLVIRYGNAIIEHDQGEISEADLKAAHDDLIAHLRLMTETTQSKQAKIDALMLEYCPDEMTPEQVEEWGKHQRPGFEPIAHLRLRAAPDAGKEDAGAELPGSPAHSCGGFVGGFYGTYGRTPTQQEVWNAAIRSWRDLNPAPAAPPAAPTPSFDAKALEHTEGFLCRAWGETDLPEAQLVRTEAEWKEFVVCSQWGWDTGYVQLDSEDREQVDAQVKYIEADMADNGTGCIEFEIGGVSVERVTFFAASTAQAAPSPIQQFIDKQEPLGAEFEKVLNDNLDSLYSRDGAAPVAAGVDAMGGLLERYERAAMRFGELWERCQGKGFWPIAESNEFTKLRDETLPALKVKILAAAQPLPPPTAQPVPVQPEPVAWMVEHDGHEEVSGAGRFIMAPARWATTSKPTPVSIAPSVPAEKVRITPLYATPLAAPVSPAPITDERIAMDAKYAERYRWLRAEHERVDPVAHVTWKKGLARSGSEWVNTANLDADIDAAIEAEIRGAR